MDEHTDEQTGEQTGGLGGRTDGRTWWTNRPTDLMDERTSGRDGSMPFTPT